MKKCKILLVAFLIIGLNSVTLKANNPLENMNESRSEINEEKAAGHLLIVWTSSDPEIAHKMVFMYAYNAQKNGWWDKVTLLIWGPSSKLTSEDAEIQESLKKMQEEGVELLACKGCADLYGVSSILENLGVEVKYTGTYLTEFIKSGKKVITF